MKQMILSVSFVLISLALVAQPFKSSSRQTETERLNELYCTGLFKSSDGVILDVGSQPGAQSYMNILNWLQGRVSGLQVYTNRSGASIPVLRGGVPAIFVDEMQVSPNFAGQINVSDIAMVKVIKTPFFGGFNGGHGAIAIYTFGTEEEEE